MTRAATAFLLYLDRYLTNNPGQQRELFALHRKITGRPLDDALFNRHRKRRVEPGLSRSLVYLIFLHSRGELMPATRKGDLFTYKNPRWLKA